MKSKTHQPETKVVFGQSVKARAQLNERPWSIADSAAVGRELFGHLTKDGEPIKLSEEQDQEISLVFDAKKLQMATLERVATDCGVEIPEETRGLLERILDHAEFQQELIGAEMKNPSRKKREKLTKLFEEPQAGKKAAGDEEEEAA